MNNKPHHGAGFYSLVGFAIALIFGVFVSAPSLLYRVINGLFVGGVVLLIYGALSYISKVGFFDIVVYSHKKLRQYSRRNEQDRKDGIEDDDKKVGSFHDFLLEKEEKQVRTIPIIIGAVFTAVSIVLIFVENIF